MHVYMHLAFKELRMYSPFVHTSYPHRCISCPNTLILCAYLYIVSPIQISPLTRIGPWKSILSPLGPHQIFLFTFTMSPIGLLGLKIINFDNWWGMNFNVELYPYRSFANIHYIVFRSIGWYSVRIDCVLEKHTIMLHGPYTLMHFMSSIFARAYTSWSYSISYRTSSSSQV